MATTTTKNTNAGSDFDTLWLTYSPRIKRCCYHWLNGNSENINDAMSLAQEKAYRYSLRDCEPIKHYFSWLYRLTYNICIDIHRANARQQEIVNEVSYLPNNYFFSAKTSETLDEQMSRQDRYDILMALIGKLPEEMKLLVRYRFVEELNYAQIAKLLNINQANVRKKVQLIRERLRREMLTGSD